MTSRSFCTVLLAVAHLVVQPLAAAAPCALLSGGESSCCCVEPGPPADGGETCCGDEPSREEAPPARPCDCAVAPDPVPATLPGATAGVFHADAAAAGGPAAVRAVAPRDPCGPAARRPRGTAPGERRPLHLMHQVFRL